MGAPRFEPRSFAALPKLFGKEKEIVWNPVSGRDAEARLRAAKLQHHFSYLVWRSLQSGGWTVGRYTTAVGTDYDRFGRILRGEIPAKFEDLFLAAEFFSFDLRLAPMHQPAS
ncbi:MULTISPECIES: hypothetical protein [Agromyces]|jgi:hypothetical protein|uniref:hypothetical protein n=1 Tax=Agromyces TaxID=33877 RepID=UPI00203B47F2|nr:MULTISPECIES: hypothetical protein [Agromyces]GLU88071.1 hypothetical protein Agsp01_03260 [Agromyces sp. NBRC 114283]